MNSLVIIPAFNESKTIKSVVEQVHKYTDKILVIDDCSTDNTSKNLENCVVVRNEKNLGKGASLRRGFKYAIKNGFDPIIMLDADGEHNPDDIPVFLNALKTADFVIGQRSVQRSFGRYLLNQFSSFWFNLIFKNLTDTQCGFRAIRVDLLKKMNLNKSKFDLEMEMLLEAVKNNARIIPLHLKALHNSSSHVTLADYLKINNAFDEWVIKNYDYLNISSFNKILLSFFAPIGLLAGNFLLKFTGGQNGSS